MPPIRSRRRSPQGVVRGITPLMLRTVDAAFCRGHVARPGWPGQEAPAPLGRTDDGEAATPAKLHNAHNVPVLLQQPSLPLQPPSPSDILPSLRPTSPLAAALSHCPRHVLILTPYAPRLFVSSIVRNQVGEIPEQDALNMRKPSAFYPDCALAFP